MRLVGSVTYIWIFKAWIIETSVGYHKRSVHILTNVWKSRTSIPPLCRKGGTLWQIYLFHYRVLLQDGKGRYRLLLCDFTHLTKNVHVTVHACLCVLVCSSCCKKRPQTGCLKLQMLISHGSEDWKSMIKVPVNSASSGALLLAWRQLPSHCALMWLFLVAIPCGRCRRNCSLVPPPLLIRKLVLSNVHLILVISFNLKYLSKAWSPNTMTLKTGASTYEFGGDTVQSITL